MANTLLDDVEASAQWIAQALSSSGYKADFSPESFWEIDRFFDEQTQDGKAKPGGLLAESLGQRLFAMGSYLGEVVLRSAGGRWVAEDSGPESEMNVMVELGDGTQGWPVQRAMKRFQNGAEDGIAVWGLALGVPVGPEPERKQRGFWRGLFG